MACSTYGLCNHTVEHCLGDGSQVLTFRSHAFLSLFTSQKNQTFENTLIATNRARNEYLIQLCAANQSISRYFTDEVSDIIDVSVFSCQTYD